MALTRITKGVIKPNENYDTHNIVSTGIVTSVGLDVNGNADVSGSLSVGGVLTYEDVTNIDSVGIITAQKDIHVGAGVSAVGVGTFGSLDIGGDIDVDGHTNLDNVSVAGVSTFTGTVNLSTINSTASALTIHNTADRVLIKGSNRIDLADDQVRFQNRAQNAALLDATSSYVKLYQSGNEKLATYSGGVSISGNIIASGNIQANTNITISNIAPQLFLVDTNNDSDFAVQNINGSFIVNDTTNSANRFTINSSGNATFANDLDVDGHTNLDNVSIAGITTFTNSAGVGDFKPIQLEKSGTTGATRIQFLESGTNKGGITYSHDNNRIEIQAESSGKIRFNDVSNAQFALLDGTGLTVNGASGITALAADINGDLDVDGHTNLDNTSIVGIVTISAGTNNEGLRITGQNNNAVIFTSPSINSSAGYRLNHHPSTNVLRVDTTNQNGTYTGTVASFSSAGLDMADNIKLRLGTSQDLTLYHYGNNAYVDNATGSILFRQGGSEKLRIDPSYARIGINTTTFDTAGSQLKIEGRGTGTTSPPYLQIKGVGNGNLHSYVDLIATSDSNAGSAYRGLGIVMHDEPTNVEWFSGRPYAGSDKFIIGRKASPSYRTQSGEVANSFFQITSTGQLLQGETSAVDSNTAIQFRKDVVGNQARFIFRNRGNDNSSRVQIQCMTLNRAANADVFSGIEKYQSGGMSIYNGENTNQHSQIAFGCNGWTSLRLRNGNHSGYWVGQFYSYWGTSNGLRMEVGGPQSGTWQAIDFHTSHTGTQRGYIGVTYGGVSYNSSSDYRMKQDVVDMTGAIDRIKLFLPKRFKWKEDPTHTVDGFLAHEAATVVPESVQGEKDGEQMQVMDNSKLVPVLTAALKEAIAKIEILEAKVAALESS